MKALYNIGIVTGCICDQSRNSKHVTNTVAFMVLHERECLGGERRDGVHTLYKSPGAVIPNTCIPGLPVRLVSPQSHRGVVKLDCWKHQLWMMNEAGLTLPGVGGLDPPAFRPWQFLATLQYTYKFVCIDLHLQVWNESMQLCSWLNASMATIYFLSF